jgi:hypothetical protein
MKTQRRRPAFAPRRGRRARRLSRHHRCHPSRNRRRRRREQLLLRRRRSLPRPAAPMPHRTPGVAPVAAGAPPTPAPRDHSAYRRRQRQCQWQRQRRRRRGLPAGGREPPRACPRARLRARTRSSCRGRRGLGRRHRRGKDSGPPPARECQALMVGSSGGAATMGGETASRGPGLDLARRRRGGVGEGVGLSLLLAAPTGWAQMGPWEVRVGCGWRSPAEATQSPCRGDCSEQVLATVRKRGRRRR